MSVIGYATLQVIPSMRGAQAAMSRQMAPIAGSVGRGAGTAMGGAMAGAVGAQRNMFQRAGARIGQTITAPIPVAARNAFRTVGTHAATAGAAIGTHIGGSSRRASREVAGIGGSFRSMAKFAGTAMAALGLASFVGDIYRVGSGAQKTQASLDAMYQASGHGAREASKATGLLFDKFGSSSLGMGAFQQGAETLAYLGMNASDSVGVMGFLENAILATGGSADNMRRVTEALTSSQNRGKATMQELNRISQAGVPILDMLSAHLGTTTGEIMTMASSGEISVDDLTTVLLEVPGKWGPALNDAADEVRDTLPNAMRSARESVVNGIAFGLMPAFDALAPVVTRAGERIQAAMVRVPELLNRAKDAVSASGLPDFFAAIRDRVGPLLPQIGRFVAVFAGLKVAAGLVSGVGLAFRAVSMVFLGNPVVLALAAITTGFLYAWQNSERFRDIVTGAIDRVRSIIDDLRDRFAGGGGLSGAMDRIRGIASRVADAFRSGGAVFEWVSDLVGRLKPRFSAIGDSFSAIGAVLGPVISWIGERLPGAFTRLWSIAQPILEFIVRLIGDTLSTAIDGVVQVFQGAVRAISGVLNIFAGLFTGDWSRMWQGVRDFAGGIFGAIVGIIRTWLTVTIFRVIGSAFGAIRALFSSSWAAIRGIFTGAGRSLVQTVRGWSDTIRLRIMYAMDAVRAGITSVWNAITGFFRRILSNLRTAIGNAFTAMRNTVRSAMDTVRLQIGAILSLIRTAWQSGWTAVRTFLSNAWSAMRSLVSTAIGAVRTTITRAVDGIRNTWNRVWGGIRDTFRTITGNIRTRASDIMDTVRSTFQRGIDRVKDIFNGLSGSVRDAFSSVRTAAGRGLNRVIGVINRMIGGVNRVAGAIGLGDIVSPIATVQYHDGGIVGQGGQKRRPGQPLTRREQLAVLERDEEVLTRDDPRHALNGGDESDEIGGPVDFARRVARRAKDAASSAWSSVRGLIADTVRPLIRNLKESAAARSESMGPLGRVVAGTSNRLADGALEWLSGVDAEAKEREVPDIPEGVQGGPGRWRDLWAAVKGQFPWARLTSAYRPGAITATGRRSLHGQGRAIDVAGSTRMNHPQMLQIAQWIDRNYRATELIYSRGPSQSRGRRWTPTGVTRANHFDHVHWGMANGAWVPPQPGGVPAVIGEGRHAELVAPEPMLRGVVADEFVRANSAASRPIQVTVNSHDTARVARDIDDVLGWQQRVAAGWGS